MQEKLISADNHIDLTYCPADLWSAQAPRAWHDMIPRTEERGDGLHWIVDGQDRGMWNGVGPGFLKYQKGSFHHVDEMKDAGFEWDYHRGAKPAPDHAGNAHRRSRQGRRRRGNRVRLPDDQRDDQRHHHARLGRHGVQRLGRGLREARRSEPRVPAGDRAEQRPEIRRRRSAALREDGAAWRRPRVQADGDPAVAPRLVRVVGSRRGMPLPDLLPLHRLQGGPRAGHAGDGKGIRHRIPPGPLRPVPDRHDGSAGVAAGVRRLREIPRFQLRPGRVRRDLAALHLRPARHRVSRPRPQPGIHA